MREEQRDQEDESGVQRALPKLLARPDTHAQGFPAPSDELVQDWVNHKLAHEDEDEAAQERSRLAALLGQWGSPTAKGSAPRA